VPSIWTAAKALSISFGRAKLEMPPPTGGGLTRCVASHTPLPEMRASCINRYGPERNFTP